MTLNLKSFQYWKLLFVVTVLLVPDPMNKQQGGDRQEKGPN